MRAGILEGRIEAGAGNPDAAIRAYERAARHDPDYLPEFLPSLLSCYGEVGDTAGARAFLNGTSQRLFDTGLSLPSGSVLTEVDLARVDAALEPFVGGRRG